MEDVWEVVTIVVTTSVATGTIVAAYFSHQSKMNERIKDLENTTSRHKFVIDSFEQHMARKIQKELDKEE